jgi:hypothetical protein
MRLFSFKEPFFIQAYQYRRQGILVAGTGVSWRQPLRRTLVPHNTNEHFCGLRFSDGAVKQCGKGTIMFRYILDFKLSKSHF